MKKLNRFYGIVLPKIYKNILFRIILDKGFKAIFKPKFQGKTHRITCVGKNLIVPKIFSMKILFLAEKYFFIPLGETTFL